MALGWREKMREGAMTHRVGVLVASQLHQRRTVLPLPGSGGALASTTLAFLRLRATTTVLPRAHPAGRRDVLLVAVSCGRSGSAVAGNTVRKWKTCLSSPVAAAPSLSAPHWRKGVLERRRWGHPSHYFFFYLSATANELFTFHANSIYYLLSTRLIDIFFAVFGLMRPSNPYVTDLSGFTKSPSTRISCFQEWLQLLWLQGVSVGKVTTQERDLAVFTVTKTPSGSHSTAMRQWGQVGR